MIRFYEKKGLISPKRYENGYRNYSNRDIFQLVTIRLYSGLGIPLDSIRALMQERNTDLFIEELSEAQDALKEEESLLEQRLELNAYLQSLFAMYKEGVPFKAVESKPFYYYQREDVEEYASLSIYQCARPILRIKRENLSADTYEPYDQGKMFLRKVNRTLKCDYYEKHMYYQVIRFVGQNREVDGTIIHPVLEEMERNGYLVDGDLFLSQIAGYSSLPDQDDMVSISVMCKKKA